jgi:hypothetical protein
LLRLEILLRHAMLLWYAIHALRHLLALLLLCLRCTHTNIGVSTALLQLLPLLTKTQVCLPAAAAGWLGTSVRVAAVGSHVGSASCLSRQAHTPTADGFYCRTAMHPWLPAGMEQGALHQSKAKACTN